MIAQEKTLAVLGRLEGYDLTQAADTEDIIYTCPTGKIAVPVMVIASEFDEAVDEAVITLGIGGGSCDEFLGDQTLTNGNVNLALIMQPLPNATPVTVPELVAGETLSSEITTPETTGAATCTLTLLGWEMDA